MTYPVNIISSMFCEDLEGTTNFDQIFYIFNLLILIFIL